MTMNKYEVLHSYTTVEVHIVPAENEDQAKELAMAGEYFYKTYDGDYDDEITVIQIEEEDDEDHNNKE